MKNRFGTLALAAALTVGVSSIAMAQCPPGYAWYGGACQPAATPGGIVGGAIGTAGAIAGTAIGTAGAIAGTAVGAAAGTAAAVVGAYPYGYNGPRCPRGYRFYSGACYLR